MKLEKYGMSKTFKYYKRAKRKESKRQELEIRKEVESIFRQLPYSDKVKKDIQKRLDIE